MLLLTEVLHFVILSVSGFFFVFGYVSEPQLVDLKNGHTVAGSDVALQCSVSSKTQNFVIEWRTPFLDSTSDRVNTTTVTEKHGDIFTITSTYIMSKSTVNDTSLYHCSVTDTEENDNKFKYIWVPVYDIDEHIIEFENDFVLFNNGYIEIQVDVKAHPKPKFTWLDKHQTIIHENSTKFQQRFGNTSNEFINYRPFLKFTRISVEDFGNYTLLVENKNENASLEISVNITGAPMAILGMKKLDGASRSVKCQAIGFPKPKIEWEFESCSGVACFVESEDNAKTTSKLPQSRSEDVGLQAISSVELTNSSSGLLRVISSNTLGQNISTQYIYTNNEKFEVFSPNFLKNGSAIELETLINDNITMICAVSLDEYYPEIKWYRSGRNYSLDDIRVPIKGFDEYHIETIDAVYSTISIVRVNIDKKDQGEYYCKATTKNGTVLTKTIQVVVRELPSLKIASNMQNKTVKVKEGKSWRFYCNVAGYPTPHITWYKSNGTITNTRKFSISDYNQTLVINDITEKDNGTYYCMVNNRLSENVKLATLEAIGDEFDWLMAAVIVLVLVLVVVTAFIMVKLRKDYKLKKELEAMGLMHFEEGTVECLNPELGLDDQAEFLPYDRKFEILPKNLKLGKELGSGAFGIVLKAELLGFPIEGAMTVVAVKTVNKLAGHDCIKALASELKIMVHLGSHPNIVNLIGACTKDILKKKLLVVVEFCPFGNLHDWILNHSHSFVDQRKEDGFDWTKKSKLEYVTLEGCDSEESLPKYIYSQDFVIWALQIAKGMEYLATNKVLHGDLAARNVLLSEDNVVKISDFGLARNMYKNDVYKKTSNEPLPVKWMALESIGESVFSSQSDVWSFGVVLWEFFSLAKTPYPGIPINQSFYQMLMNGYRMEKPEFATNDMYEIMTDCWKAKPTDRPTFTQLADRIGKVLEAPIKQHYLELTSPYVVMRNRFNLTPGIDYITMGMPKTEVLELNVKNLQYFHNYQNADSYSPETEDKVEMEDEKENC